MSSTRSQKAKARKSREMDMMSDFENLNVILRNDSVNPIARELSNVIGNSGSHCDNESNLQPRENDSYENDFGHYAHENMIPRQDRFKETMETFTSEFNMRLSQEMDSMMSMMYSQINRSISTAIAERVISEIQNIVSPMSSSRNRDTEASLSPDSQENTERNNGFKSKITKKDSRSACNPRNNRDRRPYTARPRKLLKVNFPQNFQTTLIKSKNFSHNRKLTSIVIVFCLNKTFFTHFNYNFDRIDCFLGLKTGS